MVETVLANQLEGYLNLSTELLKVTAGNMANVDTPGFKTKGFDFNAAMASSLASSVQNGQATAGTPGTAPRITEVDGLLPRPDGNDVSMDREGLNMAEAQLKFRTGVELLKREYSRISDAIHADSK